MSLPTLQEWKSATHKWFSLRNGAIAVIDEKLGAVEKNPQNRAYVQREIVPYVATQGGLKVLADIP